MRFTLRALAENWKLKLAAFTLAVLLWVVVSAEQITSQWLPVQVELVSRDPDWVVVRGPIPAEVEVRFAGPGRELWELALDRPVLVLPITGVEEPNQVFVLDPRMVRVPGNLAVNALDVRPSTVRVFLERRVTREVPVRVRIGARSHERYTLTEGPHVTPATVRITGPAARVAEIESVPTEALDLTGTDSTFNRIVALEADSVPGVRVTTDRVRVSGRVDRLVERIFPRLPVSPVSGVEVSPAQVDVRVQGPASQVRALDPAVLRVVVPADSIPAAIPPGGVSVPLRVENLPAGLEARTAPPTARVVVPGLLPELTPEGPPVTFPDTLLMPFGRVP